MSISLFSEYIRFATKVLRTKMLRCVTEFVFEAAASSIRETSGDKNKEMPLDLIEMLKTSLVSLCLRGKKFRCVTEFVFEAAASQGVPAGTNKVGLCGKNI